MTNEQKTKPGKKEIEKEFRRTIQEKLALSLGDYKDKMGENAFQKSIKRTGKILAKDISIAMFKKNKKEVKKVNKKYK